MTLPADSAKPKPLSTYTAALTPEQAGRLREILQERGFTFADKPHCLFSASKDKLVVLVYAKGPKVLLQGRGLEDFITFVLEPEVLGTATLGYEQELHPEMFSPHIGVDETGKGDLFGPLVVAASYVDADLARAFRQIGITDSKRITSDGKIRALATEIRRLGAPHAILRLRPAKYNELYRKFGNLNRLLAWGHARVVENLLEQVPDCPRALSDKFAHASLLQRALGERGRRIELEQRPKAESDPAVAAASILAREQLIDWLDRAAKDAGESTPFPRGASAQVKTRAVALGQQYGADALPQWIKMHFKTAAEVLQHLPPPSSSKA